MEKVFIVFNYTHDGKEVLEMFKSKSKAEKYMEYFLDKDSYCVGIEEKEIKTNPDLEIGILKEEETLRENINVSKTLISMIPTLFACATIITAIQSMPENKGEKNND